MTDFSSFAARGKSIEKACAAREKRFGLIRLILSIIVTVNSLAFVVIEYGIFKGKTDFSKGSPASACYAGLQSADFDVTQTEKFDQWLDDSSVLELAQTGIYRGTSDIREYVDFPLSLFFQFSKRSTPYITTPISLTENECVINMVTSKRLQIDSAFSSTPKCLDTAVAITLYFTVEPKFHVKRINLFYPNEFLALLFSSLDSDAVRDYVCDTMESNCEDTTFQLNNLTSTSCRDKYDSLPTTNALGYLDDRTKGCRILHSAFAVNNKEHCSHLSFIPQEDSKGYIKCQESKNTKPEDLFSEYELDTIHEIAVQKGYPADTLYKSCEYDPSGSFVGEEEKKKFDLGVTDTIPLASFDTQEFLCLITFVMWATMVRTGIGSEFFFSRMFLRGNWNQDKENLWRLVQFLFPLLGATTVGLANTHNYLAFPFLVITMWKFGFPETILYLHTAIYEKNRNPLERTIDF